MSHETHHQPDNSPKTSSTSAFWFVLILIGLFVAAVNFVNVMGSDEGDEGAGHGAAGAHETHEATSTQSLEGETGVGLPAADTTQHHGSNTAVDTAHMEGH